MKTSALKQTRSKKMATAALAGLMAIGTLSACTTQDSGAKNGCSASGCNQKKESHSCEGKNGCKGKSGCEGKSGCGGKNGCKH